MVSVAVEGQSDSGAARSVVEAAGHTVTRVVVSGGESKLDAKIGSYAAAASHGSWVVFRDSDGVCPVELRNRLSVGLDLSHPRFALRIAHSMTEAWLLADRSGFAEFFRVRLARVPTDPEALGHAKQSLLSVCSSSASRAMRRDVVTSDNQTGPLYVTRINEFAREHWHVGRAMEVSPRLERAVRAIGQLPGGLGARS